MGDKRKAAAELDAAAAKKAAKRQKQKAAKLKQKRRRREVLKEDSRIVRACTAEEQAAFFQHACFGSLSQLEREEFPLTAAHFQRVADADQPAAPRRLALSLRPLVSANAGEAPTGSPRVICVCQGALRAVDVARGFAPLQCGEELFVAYRFNPSHPTPSWYSDPCPEESRRRWTPLPLGGSSSEGAGAALDAARR